MYYDAKNTDDSSTAKGVENTWIAFEPTNARPGYGKGSDSKRKEIRAAAARSSAAARKATIAKKEEAAQKERRQPLARTVTAPVVPSGTKRKATLTQLRSDAASSASRARPTTSAAATTQLLRNASMASTAFETHLWTRMLLNPDFHAVSLFVVSTETNILGLADRGGSTSPTALFLKGMALKCMQKASNAHRNPKAQTTGLTYVVDAAEATNSFVVCLSALAGWEKVHGDRAWYEIHMKALRSVDADAPQPRSPGHDGHDNDDDSDNGNDDDDGDDDDDDGDDGNVVDVLHSVTSTIRKCYCELATLISTDGTFAINPNLDTMRTKAGPLPTLDYSTYNLHRPETRTLLFLLSRLANYDLMAPNGWTAMYELSILVFSWRTAKAPPVSWRCMGRAEDVEDLTLYHVRFGMVAILGAWTYAVGTAKRDEGYFRVSDSMDEHYLESLSLETAPLFGTVFEEAALWSLFIVTATATAGLWKRKSLDLLRRLLCSPRINVATFEALEGVLRKYAYREVVHKKNCHALWRAVMEGVLPAEDQGLRKLEISLADLAIR